MKINGISASSYDTYSWCEWKFFLQQVLGFEDESGPAALQGTIAHKVLEVLSKLSLIKHNKDSRFWDLSYLWELSYNHYSKKEPAIAEQMEFAKLKKVCKGIYELIESEYTPIRDNTISAEAGFNLSVVDPAFAVKRNPDNSIQYLNLRGRIDRVDKLDEETIEVIDYKTGSRVDWNSKDRHKKDNISLHNEIQPRMYHVAAKHLYPWAKNILVTFIYIVDGGPVTVPFCEHDLDDTKQILQKRFRHIKNNESPERNITWKCNKLCSFKRMGICDEVWKEKDELGLQFTEDKYTILNVRKRR